MKKRKGFIFKNSIKSTRYPVIEVEKPELYRDVYPYSSMVKVSFDHKI